MDIGLERLRNMVLDMADLSEKTVSTSIDAYVQGKDLRERIYAWSEQLRMLQDEVSELAEANCQVPTGGLRFAIHQIMHGSCLWVLAVRKIRPRYFRCPRNIWRPIKMR